ncbi:MAG: glycosyltransferase family 4 protein [candidate division Zixibacteria bacterium]|nr:glycosyltransferase family 4 protein [candidate division Zixibacteria bacterium]
MKHLIIGPCPPPYGGISVYIHRFAARLTGEGHEVSLFDYSHTSRLRRYLRLLSVPFRGYDTVHLNTISYPLAVYFLITGLAGRTVYTSHGALAETWSARQVRLFGALMRACREVILVGEHLREVYARKGINLPPNTTVRNAFLPPDDSEEAAIRETYPDSLTTFLAGHRPIIVANAYQLVHHGGTDLYGLDLCVDLLARLKPDYPEVGLVFAIAEIGDHAYFESVQRLLDDRALTDHVCFLTAQKQLWPLFKNADVFVRPTSIDGYGISIDEALHFGCPAVASDVCKRAAGAAIFRSRDIADFEAKCREALGPSD